MESAPPLYAESPLAQIVAPWLATHLPTLNPVVRHRLTQLTTGLMERTDVRVEQIAQGSAFRATTISNATHVRRILRDTRISIEDVYIPLITSLLASITNDMLYICFDESSHTTITNIFQVTLVTDGMALPLSFFLYEPQEQWADDARCCLEKLATVIPSRFQVIILADRIHAGKPFIACIESLGWKYILRLPKDTLITVDESWKRVDRLHPRRAPTRCWEQVNVWKTDSVRANIVVHRHERSGHRAVLWYMVTNLAPTAQCCVQYAYRWWHECGFKIMKSAVFNWERSRVHHTERIEVLVIGIACATWMLWMLGRAYEQRPTLKPTTVAPQRRRFRIIRIGIHICQDICTRRRLSVDVELPPLRVGEYERMFVQKKLSDVMH